MSILYGFKYTIKEYGEYYNQYSILLESDNRYYIDKFYKGAKQHIDITDKIDDFCKAIEALGINEWNMKYYESGIEWFPPADDWTLEIHTDSIDIACKGCGARPEGWESFKKIINQMGDIISE